MREAARQNCQTLTQSHLTPVNAPTASHARLCSCLHAVPVHVCEWAHASRIRALFTSRSRDAHVLQASNTHHRAENRTRTHKMTPLPALDAAHVADFNAEGANASRVGDRKLLPHLLAVAGACQDTTPARHAGCEASLRGSGSATVISDDFFSLAARAPAWSKESSSSAPGSMPAGMDDTSPGGGSYMKPSAPPCGPEPRSSAFPHRNDGLHHSNVGTPSRAWSQGRFRPWTCAATCVCAPAQSPASTRHVVRQRFARHWAASHAWTSSAGVVQCVRRPRL
jgi:hypothetical protein